MVFSSLAFLYAFLPLTFLLYFSVPKKLQNVVLLLSGLLFYAWGEPVYILVMLFSTFVDYMAGRLMARYDEQPKMRLVFLIVSVCVNLGMLAVFKYNSFVVQNVNMLFGTGFTDPKIPLPIGISFYTFQSMSYTIVYQRPCQKGAACQQHRRALDRDQGNAGRGAFGGVRVAGHPRVYLPDLL